MPKLFEPPLRARQRSELMESDAVVIEPVASTISQLMMLEQAKPKRGVKKESPPSFYLVLALELTF